MVSVALLCHTHDRWHTSATMSSKSFLLHFHRYLGHSDTQLIQKVGTKEAGHCGEKTWSKDYLAPWNLFVGEFWKSLEKLLRKRVQQWAKKNISRFTYLIGTKKFLTPTGMQRAKVKLMKFQTRDHSLHSQEDVVYNVSVFKLTYLLLFADRQTDKARFLCIALSVLELTL